MPKLLNFISSTDPEGLQEKNLPARERQRLLSWVIYNQIWAISSVGRASALQAGGHRFKSDMVHHIKTHTAIYLMVKILDLKSETIRFDSVNYASC